MCDREIRPTPESRRYGVNSSGDEYATGECRRYGAKSPGGKNVQLMNVDGTEPSRQEKGRHA